MNMRFVSGSLILFAILDVVSLLRAQSAIRVPFLNTDLHLGTLLLLLLHALLVASFVVSAYGFLRGRRWAFKLYYAQFPLRVFYATFSFGFVTYPNRFVHSDLLGIALLVLAALLEIVRLGMTVVADGHTRTD